MPVKKTTASTAVIKKLSEIGETQFITSGFKEIDGVTGGFPRARITEIYGKQGVGKTTLVTKCLAALTESGAKVLFIDAENALNPARFKELGGDLSKVDFSTEQMLEPVVDLVLDNINNYDIIVVDSVAALTPKTELEGETGAANVGVKAKRVHQWMRKMIGVLGKSDCALVLINQLHESPDMFIPSYTTGGTGIPYAASLRIQLSNNKADRIGSPGAYKGVIVHVEVTKSKVSKPYEKTKFKLYY